MKNNPTVILILLLCHLAPIKAQPAYNLNDIQMETLGRGLTAMRADSSTVILTWRYLHSDSPKIMFNVYKDGSLLTPVPISSTFLKDNLQYNQEAFYEVRAVLDGKEKRKSGSRFLARSSGPVGYISIPVKPLADGITPSGETYSYYPGDSSVGDVDGDGEYELVVRMEPTNRRDNAHDGYTGNVYVDCYELTGEFLWRINLGRNIRAGSHYVGILVYDFDGDGKAEVVTRTCDGTVDASGKVIGDPDADWREEGEWFAKNKKSEPKFIKQGRILKGKDYLTVFSGKTGKALNTIEYIPQRGAPEDWGDSWANRSDRFLACAAYLDGVHPSIVMCRGYYTRTVLAAFDWDGKKLSQRWIFDSDEDGNEAYAGQGFHNLRVGDVDSDGRDEIVYGSCTIDDDGKGLYSTGLGHGDAIHMTCFDPASSSLQIWDCHENKKDGSVYRDAATGKILFQLKSSDDVGRCMAADIDPSNHGVEMWSTCTDGLYNILGEKYVEFAKIPPMSMAVWWDGDLSRELLNKNLVVKYKPARKRCFTIAEFKGAMNINGTKGTPLLQADILGDWREEIILMSEDFKEIRIYVSPIPTKYRFHTFMSDPIYRVSVAYQNVGYNQPTQPGFYFGPDLPSGWFRGYEIK